MISVVKLAITYQAHADDNKRRQALAHLVAHPVRPVAQIFESTLARVRNLAN